MAPKKIFLDRRVLVTGASGFIGQHLVRELHSRGAHITTISRNPAKLPHDITQCNLDIGNSAAVDTCFSECRPEYIFHLAAYKDRVESIQAFHASIDTNVKGSLNIFSAAHTLECVKSIITLGTAEEYGSHPPPFSEIMRESPVTPYSFSKVCTTHLGELFSQLYGIPVTIIRPTLAYGPGQGSDMFLPSLITTLLQDKPFTMTYGDQTRDFIFIADLVEALIIAAQNPQIQGQILNIGTGIPIKLSDITHKIERMLGKEGLVRLGERPYRKNEIMEYYVETKKAKELLGWKAKTSIDDGLRETITYYRGVCGQ